MQTLICLCGEPTRSLYYKYQQRQTHHAPSDTKHDRYQLEMKVCTKCGIRFSICKQHKELGWQAWRLMERDGRQNCRASMWMHHCKVCVGLPRSESETNSVLCPGCKAPFANKGPKWYLSLQKKCRHAKTRDNIWESIEHDIKSLINLGERPETMVEQLRRIAFMPSSVRIFSRRKVGRRTWNTVANSKRRAAQRTPKSLAASTNSTQDSNNLQTQDAEAPMKRTRTEQQTAGSACLLTTNRTPTQMTTYLKRTQTEQQTAGSACLLTTNRTPTRMTTYLQMMIPRLRKHVGPFCRDRCLGYADKLCWCHFSIASGNESDIIPATSANGRIV